MKAKNMSFEADFNSSQMIRSNEEMNRFMKSIQDSSGKKPPKQPRTVKRNTIMLSDASEQSYHLEDQYSSEKCQEPTRNDVLSFSSNDPRSTGKLHKRRGSLKQLLNQFKSVERMETLSTRQRIEIEKPSSFLGSDDSRLKDL